MMAGAGGATRATGWRATALRFQQLRRRMTSVDHNRTPLAHARGGCRYQRALRQADLHRPARRGLRLHADVDISFW